MMRRFGIGLALATAAAAVMAASASYAKDTTATDLPPLLASAQAPCTMTDSRFIAEGEGPGGVKEKVYEAACKEGMGYIVISKAKTPVAEAYDCFSMAQPGPDGKPGSTQCKLPANAKPLLSLQTLFNTADRNCTVTNARLIGSSADNTFVELACQGGQGYMFGFARRVGGPPPIQFTCYDPNAKDNLKCQLTDGGQVLATVTNQLVAASGKACTVKDRRYIGTTTDGVGIFEVACDNGKGMMLETTGDKLKQAVDCAQALTIASGCTLTDSRAAETAQSALYSSLAKKAGFDCTVSKYAAFPAQGSKNEVVELQCSNRPDGGVGFFPLGAGTPIVYDCVRSLTEGYRCSYSKEEAAYPKITAQLKALGRGSCVVSGARALAKTDNTQLVEVACADGGLGWVMEYPTLGTGAPHLMPCASTTIGGGCQLPTNKKK